MPRVRIPRYAKLLKSSWQGSLSNPHAPAKTIAVRKFTTTHGAIAQQKAQAVGYQLQDCRSRKSPVSGHGIRAFTTDRTPTFAAMPYLKRIRRCVRVSNAVLEPRRSSLPSPSFAARPIWEPRSFSTAASPEAQRQAAIREKLARVPLYTYTQLQGSRGVSKPSSSSSSGSSSSAKSGKGHLAACDRAGLSWYASISQAQSPSRGMSRTGAHAASNGSPAALKAARTWRSYAQLDRHAASPDQARRSGPGGSLEKQALRWYGKLSK